MKELCDAKNVYYGACWGEDGVIYFGNSEGNIFTGIKETGGDSWVVTDKTKHMLHPKVAMDGNGLIFITPGPGTVRGAFSVYYLSLADKSEIHQVSNGQFPTWFGDDILVTVEDSQLISTRINTQTLQPEPQSKVVMPSKVMTQNIYSQYSGSFTWEYMHDN